MSQYVLIQREKEESDPFDHDLDADRETIFIIYQVGKDEYGNPTSRIVKVFPESEPVSAQRFLRSCQLKDGIEIKD